MIEDTKNTYVSRLPYTDDDSIKRKNLLKFTDELLPGYK